MTSRLKPGVPIPVGGGVTLSSKASGIVVKAPNPQAPDADNEGKSPEELRMEKKQYRRIMNHRGAFGDFLSTFVRNLGVYGSIFAINANVALWSGLQSYMILLCIVLSIIIGVAIGGPISGGLSNISQVFFFSTTNIINKTEAVYRCLAIFFGNLASILMLMAWQTDATGSFLGALNHLDVTNRDYSTFAYGVGFLSIMNAFTYINILNVFKSDEKRQKNLTVPMSASVMQGALWFVYLVIGNTVFGKFYLMDPVTIFVANMLNGSYSNLHYVSWVHAIGGAVAPGLFMAIMLQWLPNLLANDETISSLYRKSMFDFSKYKGKISSIGDGGSDSEDEEGEEEEETFVPTTRTNGKKYKTAE